MERTLLFYNCFISHNDEFTNIHLSDLLDQIIVLEPREKLKNLRQGNISLRRMRMPEESNDHNDRKVVFGKFRANKPYTGDMQTDDIDEIPDDVLELTSIFYIRNSRLLIVEYNHYGVRPNAIEDYLSAFLPVNIEENDFWRVRLIPIEPNIGIEDIQRSNDIRKVTFKISLTANYGSVYNDEGNQSVLGDLLNTSVEAHEQFGAKVAEISFGNGRSKIDGIETNSIVHLIRQLDLEGELFESVKLTYKSPSTRKIETVDLKNAGILKDTIQPDGDGWEAVTDEIETTFYNNGRVGANEHRNFECIPENLPQILI